MRLILKSRKPNAWEFKGRIIKVVSFFRAQGINRAILPRNYSWGKEKELTWTEYFNRRQESYFRRNPDADYDDFLASMPQACVRTSKVPSEIPEEKRAGSA